MCAIFGVYKDVNQEKADKAISLLKHRGSSFNTITESNKILCHILHPVVNHVIQPLKSISSVFMANCEIYNWKELKEKYLLNASNDAECLFQLLEKKSIPALDELDGVYALSYEKDNHVILARDIVGEKPLCYIFNENVFAFASEAKALMQYGIPIHLKPAELLYYNTKKHAIKITKKPFFTLPKETKESKNEILKKLETFFVQSINKRIDGLDNIGILFSGGIDSTFIAFLCKKLGKNVTCYTAGFQDGNIREAPDLFHARCVAGQLGFPLRSVTLNLKETEKLIPHIIQVIESTDVVKVSVALPFYCAAELAKHDRQKVLLSGLGSEELFAGYQRHAIALKRNINKECLNGLTMLWDRDLYRDDLITMSQTLELRLPFLDYNLMIYALSIPAEYKINEKQSKIILRELAMQLGIPEDIAMRKKIAAQYGSNFDKALEKLAKGKKKEYLEKI